MTKPNHMDRTDLIAEQLVSGEIDREKAEIELRALEYPAGHAKLVVDDMYGNGETIMLKVTEKALLEAFLDILPSSGSWIFRETTLSDDDVALLKELGREVPRHLGNNGECYVSDDNGQICTVASRIDRTRKTPYDAPDPERDMHARLIATVPAMVEYIRAMAEYGDAEAYEILTNLLPGDAS